MYIKDLLQNWHWSIYEAFSKTIYAKHKNNLLEKKIRTLSQLPCSLSRDILVLVDLSLVYRQTLFKVTKLLTRKWHKKIVSCLPAYFFEFDEELKFWFIVCYKIKSRIHKTCFKRNSSCALIAHFYFLSSWLPW